MNVPLTLELTTEQWAAVSEIMTDYISYGAGPEHYYDNVREMVPEHAGLAEFLRHYIEVNVAEAEVRG